MPDSLEKIAELKKYLKKLQSVINRETVFTFFKIKIVNKKPIDDILCCIEANFPEDYKKYVKHRAYSQKELKTPKLYKILKDMIQNKFSFSKSHYSVKYKNIPEVIVSIINVIDLDMKTIEEQL